MNEGGGGGVGKGEGTGDPPPPPPEASGLWKQHPPIVTRLELDLGGDETGTGCGQAERGGGFFFIFFSGRGVGGLAARQAARAVTEGRQVLLGEGWIKEINT